jgi:prepilin-type N-terminal cleavage/methylation domain-containing protein/prepilin-type processing-associated H-X9-DG protein
MKTTRHSRDTTRRTSRTRTPSCSHTRAFTLIEQGKDFRFSIPDSRFQNDHQASASVSAPQRRGSAQSKIENRESKISRRAYRPWRGGFTLIELLTVIAIIGILASILIPAVGAVRQSARTAICLGNQRQIALAINLAATDNREVYPPATDNGTLWPSSLRNYLGGKADNTNNQSLNTTLVVCPARLLIPVAPAEINRSTYSLNPVIMVDPVNEPSRPATINVSRITRPSEIVLVADGVQQDHGGAASRFYKIGGGDDWKNADASAADTIINDGPDMDGSGNAGNLRFRHKGKVNVAYTDGHAATLSKGTLRWRNIQIDY